MKYYFHIQLKSLKRLFNESGVHWLLPMLLFPVIFCLVVFFLYQKTEYADYFIAGFSVLFLLKFSEDGRIKTLKNIFRIEDVKKVRMIENLSLSLPFAIAASLNHWYVGMLTVMVSFILSFYTRNKSGGGVLKTPFSKSGIFFPSGLRRFLLGFIAAILLAILGLVFQNYNVALFSLIVQFIFIYGFYSKPEPESFVWNWNLLPSCFLKKMLKREVVNTMMLSIPLTVLLVVSDINYWYFPVVISGIGILNMINIIFSKYADFPNEVSMPNGIIVAISFVVIPLQLFTIPFLYKKAKDNLNYYLYDQDQ